MARAREAPGAPVAGELPLIEAYGTHFEVGVQLGEQCRERIHALLDLYRSKVQTNGLRWANLGERLQPYLQATDKHLPQYIDELRGVAKGAGLPLHDIFALVCPEAASASPATADPAAGRGCTDFVVGPGATADGSVLACHNEDWTCREAGWAVITRIKAGDEPEWLSTAYAGIIPTTGFNDAGISLTGNALSPNDEQTGIPKLMMVRAILGAGNVRDALAAAIMEPRASSYNNIVTSESGEAFSVEASATDWEMIPIENGVLVHTNHYVTPRMQRYEANRQEIAGSVMRYHRARRLVEQHRGRIDVAVARQILSDHAGQPGAICRHPWARPGEPADNLSQTVFSVQIDLTRRVFWASWGLTCQAPTPTAYRFRADEAR